MQSTLRNLSLASMAALLASCAPPLPPEETQQNFDTAQFAGFYLNLRQQAKQQGLDPTLLDAAFHLQPGQTPPPPPGAKTVLKSEKNQPESSGNFSAYTHKLLSDTRIANARERLQRYNEELNAVEQQTGVPGPVVVALWGVETNFGASQGNQPVIPALVTLAWKSTSRPQFFEKELFAALRVAQNNHLDPAELRGSWAGAFGQCQFMPSTYLAYAKDGDGDGFADIWKNPADVFASTGNYIHALGYQHGVAWKAPLLGSHVDLSGLDVNARGMSDKQTFAQWQQRGADIPLPAGWTASTKARYFKPADNSQPAVLLGPNFDVILGWNKSSFYAWSVLTLADRMAPGFNAVMPDSSEPPSENE